MKNNLKKLCFLAALLIFIFWTIFDIASITSNYDSNKTITTYVGNLWTNYSVSGVEFFQYILLSWVVIALITHFFTDSNNKSAFFSLPNTYKLFSHSIWGTIVYFLVFGIGIYFSIISSSIHEWLDTSNAISKLAYKDSLELVVIILLSSILLYIYHHISVSQVLKARDREMTDSYNDKISKLQGIIELSPPGDFSDDFSRYVDIAEDFSSKISTDFSKNKNSFNKYLESINCTHDVNKGYKDGIDELDLELVTKNKENLITTINAYQDIIDNQAPYIRALLVAYSRLAAFFDGKRPSKQEGSLYRANVMTKHAMINKKPPQNFRYIYELAKGKESQFIMHYLELKKGYSVEVNTDERNIIDTKKAGHPPLKFDCDENIKELSLPFFSEANMQQYNCFGAPRAAASASCQFINDTDEEIHKWDVNEKPGSELIIEARKHFNSECKSRSFISIPLQINRYHDSHIDHNYVLGVVNIYSDTPNLMMGNTNKQKQFSDITTPLNSSLARIMSLNIVATYHLNVLKEIASHASIDFTKKLNKAKKDS